MSLSRKVVAAILKTVVARLLVGMRPLPMTLPPLILGSIATKETGGAAFGFRVAGTLSDEDLKAFEPQLEFFLAEH